jgi:hypothetical protein
MRKVYSGNGKYPSFHGRGMDHIKNRSTYCDSFSVNGGVNKVVMGSPIQLPYEIKG